MRSMLMIMIAAAILAQGRTVEFPTFNSRVRMGEWNHAPLAKKLATAPSTSYYWAAFAHAIDDSLLAHLTAAGAEIMGCAGRYQGGVVYKIGMGADRDAAMAVVHGDSAFINMTPVAVEDKLEERIWRREGLVYIDSARGTIRAYVTLYHPMALADFTLLCGGCVDAILTDASRAQRFIVIAAPGDLEKLAAIDEVQEVAWYPPKEPTAYYARELARVNELQAGFVTKTHPPAIDWLTKVPYTGDSIRIAINEPGVYRHLDLCEASGRDTVLRNAGPRIKRRDAALNKWGLDEHGTNMAGMAAGNGWTSLVDTTYGVDTMYRRGVAPKALVLCEYTDTGDVNNHSFTESAAYYNPVSRYNDYVLWHHAGTDPAYNNVFVYAAANNGVSQKNGNKQQGYYSVLVASKNAIVVGATEKGRALIADFSSLGPTRDGRIKPDIMAPGAGLTGSGWHIEIDSIAIVNNGARLVWGFGNGDPGWGTLSGNETYRINTMIQAGGIMSMDAAASSYLFSNSMYPAQTMISAASDSLLVRWKITKLDAKVPNVMYLTLMWKRPQDAYAKAGDPWSSVKFPVTPTGGWQVTKIGLNDPSVVKANGGWVAGDTIDKLRFDFWHKEADLISSWRNDIYFGPGSHGTSQSCAIVSGICALMLQKYRDDILYPLNAAQGANRTIHANPPWNSTIRGILAHTARDMVDTVGECWGLDNPDFAYMGNPRKVLYGKGPDWATGYGLVDAVRALHYVSADHFREDTIAQNQTKTWYFDVPASTAAARVTLCWDDSHSDNVAAADAFHTKLINDLDLYLQNVSSGTIVRPWTLDHSWMHDGAIPANGVDSLLTPQGILAHPAVRGIDTVNNLEVVDLDNPAAGAWRAVVSGAGIAVKQSTKTGITQDYSLVSDFPLRTTLTKAAAAPAGPAAPAIDTTPIPRPALPPGSATLASGTPARAWGAWAYSAVVQMRPPANSTLISATRRGFWALVRLSGRNFDFSQARPNGRDLRFLNPDGTPLKYSISYWSRWRHKAVIWVRLPAEKPEYMIMLWGNH